MLRYAWEAAFLTKALHCSWIKIFVVAAELTCIQIFYSVFIISTFWMETRSNMSLHRDYPCLLLFSAGWWRLQGIARINMRVWIENSKVRLIAFWKSYLRVGVCSGVGKWWGRREMGGGGEDRELLKFRSLSRLSKYLQREQNVVCCSDRPTKITYTVDWASTAPCLCFRSLVLFHIHLPPTFPLPQLFEFHG